MNTRSFALSDDIAGVGTWLTALLVGLSLVMLLIEMQRRERGGLVIVLSGIAASVLCALAVVRPVVVEAKTSSVGPQIVVLIDQSRRMALLAAGDETREQRALRAAKTIGERYKDARLTILGFAGGEVWPISLTEKEPQQRMQSSSDLLTALQRSMREVGERPNAVVLISDGRLTTPAERTADEELKPAFSGIPVHTIGVLQSAPKDASIRSVRAVGAAVAHQPLTLTVEVGCSGLECKEIPVVVRELRDSVAAADLARGKVTLTEGAGKVELEITLDRAGARVVQIAIESPEGDSVPDNDSRYLTFEVARDRVRLLHLAGRPTHDVRALRMWLERDLSVDVVAFFILRGDKDNPGAGEADLSLIRFPVDELFTQHLPSFDAIILQDIDAVRYHLSQYLLRLSQYVKTGGGLIMVGGPSSFAGGNYAGTALDEIFPVEQPRGEHAFDAAEFVPQYTAAGQAAAVTRALRELLDGQLPSLAGANLLGAPRPGSIVLWEHPTLKVGQQAMPVLALGEEGDGRSIALGADSTHRLGFGALAATVSGRAYGALWDGLLGWLMRDPRYEAARVELVNECIAGYPTKLRVTRLPGMAGEITVELRQLREQQKAPLLVRGGKANDNVSEIDLGLLDVGGYSARVRIGEGPPTRHDFGCEKGGIAWSDTRPDPVRLQQIARVSGGKFVDWNETNDLPPIEMTEIVAERHTSPILPAWGWTLSAALMLGAHWVSRRYGGLN